MWAVWFALHLCLKLLREIVQSFAVKELHLKMEDETNSFHIS